VAPGLVSLAQTPLLFPPFGLPPSCSREGGGCLKDFAPFWRKSLDCSPFILEAVTGLPPPIHFPPRPFPCRGSNLSHPLRERTIIISTRTWRPSWPRETSKCQSPLSYISPIFLIPKKDGGMRPILNLKKLNAAHLNTPHFRMETVEDVRHALRPGDWATSIDLKDAYFHVPLYPLTCKYMRFGWKGRLF
jgi:hypothetical protein